VRLFSSLPFNSVRVGFRVCFLGTRIGEADGAGYVDGKIEAVLELVGRTRAKSIRGLSFARCIAGR
jgi:hypothetical protein